MITLALLLAAGVPMAAPLDVRTARTAYSGCLRSYLEKSAKDRMTLVAFKAALPNQCATEKEAFRQAMLAEDKRFSIAPSETQRNFEQEISDYQEQFTDTYSSMIEN